MLVQEKIVLSFAEIYLHTEKIVIVNYTYDEPINVEKGIRIHEAVIKLTHCEPCVVIHNMSDKYIFSSDAVRFMGSQMNAKTHYLLGRAIVTTNSASRISANNFIKLYKPVMPATLVSTLEEAIKWAENILALSQ